MRKVQLCWLCAFIILWLSGSFQISSGNLNIGIIRVFLKQCSYLCDVNILQF